MTTIRRPEHAFVGGPSDVARLFQNVLESSIEYSVAETDLDGVILQWNPGARRIYGYEPEEVIGRADAAILYTPDDPAARKDRGMMQIALREGIWEGDLDGRKKNGEHFPAHVILAPRWSSTGRPIGFVFITRNLSDEMRQMEEELRLSRERLALVLEAERIARFASWDWDLKKDVAQWSEEMFTIFGRDPSFVPTYETSLQSMHPEDRDLVDRAVRKAIAERSLYDLEYRIVRPDGSVRFLHAFGQAHYDAAGTPTRMVGAIYDITERRRAQEDLARSERRFRALFETSVDPILIVDAEGAIVGANPAMEEVTGLPGERLLREALPSLLATEDRGRAGSYIRDLLAGRPVQEPFELSIVGAKDRRILEVYGRPIRDSDSVPSVQLVARDVTERREMTRRLMESERQASIGQVASFVAHEVNNPLSNISLLTYALKKIVKEPEAQAKLDKIDLQWKVAARIVSELLDLTRARQLNASPLDLRSVVEAAVDQVAAFRRPEVALHFDPGPAPVLATADRLRMTQAIANLVKNAFQATERGSVRVRIEDRSEEVAILVSDSGPGIAPEVREKLFRSFFTTKPRGQGTGLGLLFVEFVVAAHGGRIEVESETGRGTTFSVHVPRLAAATTPEPIPPLA